MSEAYLVIFSFQPPMRGMARRFIRLNQTTVIRLNQTTGERKVGVFPRDPGGKLTPVESAYFSF